MLRLLALVGLMTTAILRLPGAPPASDAATIVDSGSTNRPGFRIVVDQAGVAQLTSMQRNFRAAQEQTKPVQRVLSPAAVKRFHSDLQAAKPLASLPEVPCMKSVSFGSTLSVVFDREQTPDLSCGDGGNVAMRN